MSNCFPIICVIQCISYRTRKPTETTSLLYCRKRGGGGGGVGQARGSKTAKRTKKAPLTADEACLAAMAIQKRLVAVEKKTQRKAAGPSVPRAKPVRTEQQQRQIDEVGYWSIIIFFHVSIFFA